MGTLISILIKFLVDLFTGAQGERSRDKANQVSGELDVENKILEAAVERQKDAQQIDKDVRIDSDDDLDERMRRNRELAHTKGSGGTDTPI